MEKNTGFIKIMCLFTSGPQLNSSSFYYNNFIAKMQFACSNAWKFLSKRAAKNLLLAVGISLSSRTKCDFDNSVILLPYLTATMEMIFTDNNFLCCTFRCATGTQCWLLMRYAHCSSVCVARLGKSVVCYNRDVTVRRPLRINTTIKMWRCLDSPPLGEGLQMQGPFYVSEVRSTMKFPSWKG